VNVLTDNNPGGGGQGSGLTGDLRYAMTHAQSGDSITFSVKGTINMAGLMPAITKNVNILGPGANLLTVHPYIADVFSVYSGANVTISGLTITGGLGSGGGIANGGTLTLNNDTISGNTAAKDQYQDGGLGGGIFNTRPSLAKSCDHAEVETLFWPSEARSDGICSKRFPCGLSHPLLGAGVGPRDGPVALVHPGFIHEEREP
jgi:hypothetical protein